MKPRILYFDESGYTGYNLLDGNQPIFSIASTDIAPEDAKKILTSSFPKYKGAEFKFTNIWRSSSKSNLIEFGRHLGDLGDHAFTWLIDKQFVTLVKMVDFLIEPFFTNAGYDFYDDGFCWKYSNYIHFGFTYFAPQELLGSLLKAYQTFSRNPSPASLSVLQSQIRIMATSSNEEVRVFLEQMSLGATLFTQNNNLETFKGSNELHLTSMLAVIAHWRKLYTDDFSVIHDASANFFRQVDKWEQITNNNVPEQMHRLGDGTYVQFPLRVVSTSPQDSIHNHAIQFCDVLAGLAARQRDSRTNEEEQKLLAEVIGAGMGEISFNGILPSRKFPDRIPPRRLTGPDIVDQMAQIIFGPHN